MNAHPEFLRGLLAAAVGYLFTPELSRQFDMLVTNSGQADSGKYRDSYNEKMLRFLDELIPLLPCPEKARECLEKQPQMIRLYLHDRYEFAMDNLKRSKVKSVTVPERVNELLRWFLVDLWDHDYDKL